MTDLPSSTLAPRAQRYTPEQVADALTRSKGLITVAARSLGCDPMTVRNYMKRYVSVQRAKDEARTGIVDLAEVRFFQAIDDGQPWAVSMALKTLGKDRGYVERSEVEHDGTVKVVWAEDGSDSAD